LGCAVAVGGCLLAAREPYHTAHRFAALACGIGVATTATGVRNVSRRRRELLLLAIPLIYPIPAVVQAMIEPIRATAVAVSAVLDLASFPVTRIGNVLHVPGAIIAVDSSCSGMRLMSQLLLLAVLAVSIVPTTIGHSVVLMATVPLLAFGVNVGRIVFLAVFAGGSEARWHFWHDAGLGRHAFPLMAAAVAILLWRSILRQRSRRTLRRN
jgi:exosortase/archaeosortase family protein